MKPRASWNSFSFPNPTPPTAAGAAVAVREQLPMNLFSTPRRTFGGGGGGNRATADPACCPLCFKTSAAGGCRCEKVTVFHAGHHAGRHRYRVGYFCDLCWIDFCWWHERRTFAAAAAANLREEDVCRRRRQEEERNRILLAVENQPAFVASSSPLQPSPFSSSSSPP